MPESGAAGVLHPSWHRVVLKLSGGLFAGAEPLGISPDVVAHLAAEIIAAVKDGVQVAAVVGGGNMFRGAALAERGIDRARADYMGMLSTVINCLALQDVLEKLGVETRGCRRPSRWARWPNRTSREGRSGTWRRAAS
jgi:uridylate kinase